MTSNVEPEHAIEVSSLQAEVRALGQRLAQREQALATLNRRLLQLERGENGISGIVRAESSSTPSSDDEELRAEVDALRRSNEALRQELSALQQTKLFRWAAPGRKAYSILRRRP